MSVSLSQLFNLSPMPPNRRILALRKVRKRAEDMKLTDVVEAIDDAIKRDELALTAESARLEERSGQSMDSTALDDRIDRTLGLIDKLLEDYAKDTDPAVADKARELEKAMFPDGLQHHIDLPHAEQHTANGHVVTLMESPEHRAWIDEHGLRSLGNRLRTLNASFGALLHAEEWAEESLTWDRLRTERRLGHERLLQVVTRILCHFMGDDQGAQRAELLQPILEQDQALQHAKRRHDTSSGT